MTQCYTTVTLIIGAASYNLTEAGITVILEDEGLGMPPLHRLRERGPLQHGETDLGFRLDPRQIQLIYDLDAYSEARAWQKRNTLLSLFKPRDDALQLRWDLPTGDQRQIDCYLIDGMRFPTSSRSWLYGQNYFGQYFRDSLVLNAPDPVFYDPGIRSATINVAVSDTGGIQIPTPVPFAVGSGSTLISDYIEIVYDGTWIEYPTIRIYGPIQDPIVRNESTGEKLDFSSPGVSITTGDYFQINTAYGQKTVVNSNGFNMIRYLSTDSDLATFHLGVDPDVPESINRISLTGLSLDTGTAMDILYRHRYIGI